MEISYLSNCDEEYVKRAKSCKSLAELNGIVTEFKELAEDAYAIVQKMDAEQFQEFCKGRRKTDPGLKWMDKYGAVLLPEKILKIGLVACQFYVPFGCAYHRLKDLGQL